ncbi:MAG: hotdog fold thioesterase [Reichenbachiella sp.]|uniref:hotdog fold thioesterase n=3 Tax=Reichenbachiella sp. TaxID=2184521 RepID=UPI003264EFEE
MFLPLFTLEGINAFSKDSMVDHIGIEFTEIGEDYLKATMPVDERTIQPLKLLHGGASVALAETLGSVAATMTVNPEEKYCVGLEINANHIKSAKSGKVEGIARPLHLGKKTQVWEIKISNSDEQLVCVSRITMAVIDK